MRSQMSKMRDEAALLITASIVTPVSASDSGRGLSLGPASWARNTKILFQS
jgi:hypothetical protein